MIEKITDFVISLLPFRWWVYPAFLLCSVILSVLIVFLLSLKKKKKNAKKELTLEDLLKISKNPKSTSSDLMSALMLFNERFSVEKNEKKSFEFFKNVLTHKRRNKKMFDYFHDTIIRKNPKYKNKLEDLEKKALNK